MARIEVEVRTVVRRLVVELDDQPAPTPWRAEASAPHRRPRPSGALPAGSRQRRLALAGGSLLVAAGLAVGQAARRRSGWPALPARPVLGRLRSPVRRAVPALPAGAETAN